MHSSTHVCRQTVAEVLMRAELMTLAELTRLVMRDQGIMGVSRAGKTKTVVTSANVSLAVNSVCWYCNLVWCVCRPLMTFKVTSGGKLRSSNFSLIYYNDICLVNRFTNPFLSYALYNVGFSVDCGRGTCISLWVR